MARWKHNHSPAEVLYKRARDYELRKHPENYARIQQAMPKEYPGINYIKQCIMREFSKEYATRTKLTLQQKQDVVTHLVCGLVHEEFVAFDRPTYLLSKELVELAMSFELSNEDIEHAFEYTPYPTFALMLEKDAFKMQYVIDQTIKLANVESIFVTRKFSDNADADSKTFLAEHSMDSSIVVVNDLLLSPVVAGFNSKKLLQHHAEMPDTLKAVLKLVASLIMLWRARPHFVQDAADKITKDERRYLLGTRKNARVWNFPIDAIVHKDTHGSDPNHPRGPVTPHWRGGHFRHYRHERYARDANGQVKIGFINPHLVGVPDDEVKNNTGTDTP